MIRLKKKKKKKIVGDCVQDDHDDKATPYSTPTQDSSDCLPSLHFIFCGHLYKIIYSTNCTIVFLLLAVEEGTTIPPTNRQTVRSSSHCGILCFLSSTCNAYMLEPPTADGNLYCSMYNNLDV